LLKPNFQAGKRLAYIQAMGRRVPNHRQQQPKGNTSLVKPSKTQRALKKTCPNPPSPRDSSTRKTTTQVSYV